MTTLDKTGIEAARDEFVHSTTKEQIERWAYKWADDLLSTADALSSLPAQAVGVKALEWSDWRDSIQGLSSRADTPFGTYRVDQRDGHCRLYFGDAFVGTYDTADNAKSAAQADYEDRIRAALRSTP